MKKISAAIAAVVLAAMPVYIANAADGDTVKVQPVFSYFNSNDVNGSVIVEIPEDMTADVLILINTPELSEEPYYKSENLAGGHSYEFLLEGRDGSDNDYQIYNFSITPTGAGDDSVSNTYTETFEIPDGNDHPDSYTTYRYKISVNDEIKESDIWEVVSTGDTEKELIFHSNAFMKGDVDGDGAVTAIDATAALMEYGRTMTDMPLELNERQRHAADIDGDGDVDGNDANAILAYYGMVQTNVTPEWPI